jgi:surface protein
MKRTLLTLILLIISATLYSQSITIGDDGIVRCKDVAIGTTQTIFGDTYEVVDRNLLIARRDQGADLTKVCVSNVTNMEVMFYNSQFNQPIGNWDVSNVNSMLLMFANSNFNQPIGNWDVSSVTNMIYMFLESPFNQPIGNWDVSNVVSMAYMFRDSKFNQPIGNWDVSNVTDMLAMFNSSDFNQPIGSWNVNSVTNMSYMFQGTRFNQQLEEWDVSSVTEMTQMFFLSQFNQPIGDWDVSMVTEMGSMFSQSQFNQPVGNWDVSRVTNMNGMFFRAQFNQPINQWCVVNISSEPENFSTGSPLTSQNKPVWGWCPGTPSVIAQLYPANNSTEIDRSVRVTWNPDPSSTKYHLQIFEGVDPLVIDVTQTDEFFLPQTPFKSNQTYNWRVRGVNENTLANGQPLIGEWSPIWKFVTVVEQVGDITLKEPQNNSTNLSVNSTLRWNKDPNAQSYIIQVSVDDFSSFIINESVQDSFFVTSGLSYNTEYQWRVKGTNTLGDSSWSSVWKFITELDSEIVNLLLPLDNQNMNIGDVVFNWTNVESAQSYTLQVANSTSFESILIDTTMSNPNALKIGTADQNGVRSNALIGNRGNNFSGSLPTANSEIWFGFTLNEINSITHFKFIPPDGFGIFDIRIFSPQNNVLSGGNVNSEYVYRTPTFTVGTYLISISVTNRNTLFHNPGKFVIRTSENEFTDSDSDSLSLSLNFEQPDTYYWRVQYDDGESQSEWSPVWKFTTLLDTSIESEEHPTAFTLSQNYPNPFNPTTQIRFALPESQQVTIQVYDVNGRLVAELLNNATYSAGNHQVTFDGSGLSSGIYIYTMRTSDGMSFTRKLILVK